MKKKFKFFIYILLFLLILPISLIKITKFIILKNINQTENFNLQNLSVGLKGINFENLIYRNDFLNLNFEKINLKKKSFIKNAFALESSGEVSNQFEKRKINASGKIKGNLINGNMNMTDIQINIQNIGNLKFYGMLENWGKDKFEGVFEINGLKLKEILEAMRSKTTFDGKIYGKIFIEKEKENLKGIRFDIEIKELTQKYETNKLNAHIKVKYLPMEKTLLIEKVLIINEKGEEISLWGSIRENEFEFYFDTKGISIDELLKLLPEEIRKKSNFKINDSKISMNKFSLSFSKKKFYLMANVYLLQNT
jgi:hypothetical protein